MPDSPHDVNKLKEAATQIWEEFEQASVRRSAAWYRLSNTPLNSESMPVRFRLYKEAVAEMNLIRRKLNTAMDEYIKACSRPEALPESAQGYRE